MNKSQQDPHNKNPREIPNKPDPGKIKPFEDPDLTPGKSNPVNPKTDEPNSPAKKQNNNKIKNPIQDDPGNQNTG